MASFGVNLLGATELIRTMQSAKAKWGLKGSDVWIVGVGAEYGAYVEFGTSRMAAQPYLVPAVLHVSRTKIPVYERKASSLNEFVAMLALGIEREAKKNAPVDTGFLRSSIEAFPADAVGGAQGTTRTQLTRF